MEYKGYWGSVVFDDGAGIFHGEVIGIRDTVTFQGESVTEVRQAFRDSIDDYLDFCAQRGEVPDKPLSGRFNVRISPELHAQAAAQAKTRGVSLNTLVEEAIRVRVS